MPLKFSIPSFTPSSVCEGGTVAIAGTELGSAVTVGEVCNFFHR